MLFEDNIPFLILKILITLISTMGLMLSTTNFRLFKRRSMSIVIGAGFVFYVILSSYAIIYFGGYEHFLRVFFVTISLPAIFLLYIISVEPFAKLVFTHATHILVSLYIAASSTLLNTALHGTMLSDILLRLLAYLLMIVFSFCFVRHIYLDFISMITKGWEILSLIPCAFIIFGLTIAFYPEHYTKRPASVVLLYLLCGVIVITYTAICGYLRMQYQQMAAEQNREILELQVQNIRKETMNIEELMEQAKITRHDTRHMLTTIASLAENGNAQAILDYVNTAASSCDVTVPAHYCRDPILDATLSSYLGQATVMGIALETSLSIPDVLPTDSAELAICFANALMIAIKECEKLPEKERKIVIKCIEKPKFMFEILNPCKGKINFNKNNIPDSSEIDLKISTQSIIAFCRRHDAFYSFMEENGWFKVMVTL